MGALILVACITGFAAVVWLGTLTHNAIQARKLNRKSVEQENAQLRGLVHRLDNLAFQHRDIAPELSFFVQAEIHNTKEVK